MAVLPRLARYARSAGGRGSADEFVISSICGIGHAGVALTATEPWPGARLLFAGKFDMNFPRRSRCRC